eukprot:gene8181-9714_t
MDVMFAVLISGMYLGVNSVGTELSATMAQGTVTYNRRRQDVAGESNKDDARQHSARGSEKSWRTRRRNQQRENNNQFKHVMVAGMAEDLFAAVLGRVAALVDHEVPAADFPMWQHLRLKELLEAMECFRALEHFIIQGIRKGRIRRILDLCCGHGLLGILLGFRFPTMEVVCVDLNPSRAFQHYKEAIAECADERCSPEQPAPASPHLGQPHDMPDCTEVPDVICSNVRLVQGDAQKVELTEDTLAVCIHGCNGISKDILTRAIAAQCLYAAEGLYGVGITHSGSSDDKYQVSVGIMAGQFHAQAAYEYTSRFQVLGIPAIGILDYQLPIARV